MIKHTLSNIRSVLNTESNSRLLRVLISSLGILVIVSVLLFPDVQFLLQSNEAQAAYYKGDIVTAQKIYSTLEEHSSLGYLATQNNAVIDYQQKNYKQALNKLIPVVKKRCFTQTPTASSSGQTLVLKTDPPTHCDTLSYNLGNMFYRVGEIIATSTIATTTATSSIPEITKQLWYQAIAAYQSDLTIEPEDSDAQENIDFILKKLQTADNATTSESEKSANESQSDKPAQSDTKNTSDNKDQTSADKKQATAEQNDDGTQSKKGDRGQESAKDTSPQSTATPDNKQLSQDASQQVDQYMQKLEQQSQQMQDYFKQNPQAAPTSPPGNSLFDDPFFNQFFGRQNTPLNNQATDKSLDKDW